MKGFSPFVWIRFSSKMKRLSPVFLFLLFFAVTPVSANGDDAQSGDKTVGFTPTEQMEKLTRGVVALPSESGGIFVSWRMLGTDPLNTTFDLLRNGQTIAENLGNKTNYTDAQGNSQSQYTVVVKVGGKETERTEAVTPWTDIFLNIRLDRPAGGVYPWRDRTYDENGKITGWTAYYDKYYGYYPQECSVGDVDGDGVYELFVKWTPTNQQDNSQGFGRTGNVYLDCYRMGGTKLWRIDLGVNIRAGSHYTQFMVYDFDGDGKAEMICKTAPGSVDGAGNYVTQAADETAVRQADNTANYQTEDGRISGGQEYLTVFNGLTGKAIHTVPYNPNRDAECYTSTSYEGYSMDTAGTFNWDDRPGRVDDVTYGNRGERYLACVAYLDGADKRPSAVMCRGYYTYAFLWAVDFDGKKLSTKWVHASRSKTEVEHINAAGETETRTYSKNTFGVNDSYTAYGQGNHQLSVVDVDGDGCDEIVYGAATIDNDGWLLYSTGLGHGDALHVGDLLPDRPGLEVFRCIESSPYGCEIHDAATGEKLFWRTAGSDTGRCMAADISKQAADTNGDKKIDVSDVVNIIGIIFGK